MRKMHNVTFLFSRSRVFVLGEQGVGKTSLITSLTRGTPTSGPGMTETTTVTKWQPFMATENGEQQKRIYYFNCILLFVF